MITNSSSEQSRFISAASSQQPSIVVGKSNIQSVEFASLTQQAEGLLEKARQQQETRDSQTVTDSLQMVDGGRRMEKVQQEIVNLYLKIKRCSKDVNITESQYLDHVETAEDREERLLIAKMDPLIVL